MGLGWAKLLDQRGNFSAFLIGAALSAHSRSETNPTTDVRVRAVFE
jgi:hypothetical protein